MCAVMSQVILKDKIETLLNKSGSRCYFLNTSNKPCGYKNSVDFDSFDLIKDFKSDIITAQYNKGPLYIEENLGFNITHLKSLIENVKTYKGHKMIVINSCGLSDRLYENKLYLSLDNVADKRKVFLEYDYKNLGLCKKIKNISIRFDDSCTVDDIEEFLRTYTKIKMIKISENLLYRYIEEDSRLKNLMKLLEDQVYIVIEGER